VCVCVPEDMCCVRLCVCVCVYTVDWRPKERAEHLIKAVDVDGRGAACCPLKLSPLQRFK